MKTAFNKSWKTSIQPRKQKKYRENAPNHIKAKMMSCHLSKELKEKHGKRSFRLSKGDKVKVMRGQFKGKSGKVDKIDVKNENVFITQIEVQKKDGSKSFYPIHPSNLTILELKLDDKKRKEALKRK
ncbi:MAG: 50S ribosomal protein L24 [Nanoarchaeota archaeon]|nr:50S ribosomal protein L24 [Nanoarchaeota archaeon]